MQTTSPVLKEAGGADNDHPSHDQANAKDTARGHCFLEKKHRPQHQESWRGAARDGIDQRKVMVTVGIREQNEVYGFQTHADEGEQPHGTRGQTGKQQQKKRQNPAQDHLPAHSNILFLSPLKKKIPKGMQEGRCDQKNNGKGWHNGMNLSQNFKRQIGFGVKM
jgi:hypothetical protein